MRIVELSWVGGDLVVSNNSLHIFGTDIPEGADHPRGKYKLVVDEINEITEPG